MPRKQEKNFADMEYFAVCALANVMAHTATAQAVNSTNIGQT
ncbi:MAG: hypothetical protein ACFCVD_19380 [Nodosilinea sp.]